MASGNYVVGRDIDFQFGDPSSAASSESSSSQHSARDSTALRPKSKKPTKWKPNDAVCHREGAVSASPKKQPKVGNNTPPKSSQGAKVKRKVQKVASTTQKSASNGGGGPASSKGSSASGPTNISSQGLSGFKRSAKSSKSPQTSRPSSSSAAHQKSARQQSSTTEKVDKTPKRKQASSVPAQRDHDQRGTNKRGHASQKYDDPDVWYSSSNEERNRVLQFWKQLSSDERNNLVSVDKDALFSLIHNERRSCSCPVCDNKREAVDEELEELFSINEPRLTQYAEALQKNDAIFIESGLDNGIRDYFKRSVKRSTEEISWIQPDFHGVLRFNSTTSSSEDLPGSDKKLYQELLENPLSDLNLGSIGSLAATTKNSSGHLLKLPKGAPTDLDTSAFPTPLAHLCNALMEIMYGEPRPDLSPEQQEMAKDFEVRVSSQLKSMSSMASQSNDPEAQASLSKQFLQIWSEMLSIYQTNRPRKRTAGPRNMTSAEVREFARDLAKPILDSSNDEIPSNTIKALMSLGPLCDSQGINCDDQRKISFEMLRSGLSERYPRIVQALFTEFAQDVENNNGSNLLQMLENLPPSDLSPTLSTSQTSAEGSANNNKTLNGLVEYYEHVNGATVSTNEFDLEVNLADPTPPLDGSTGSVISPKIDKVALAKTSPGEDDTDEDLGDETDIGDSRTFYADDEADYEADYAYSADEEDFEGDESCITEDVTVLEEREADRLLQASYFLHYLFARLFEQRVLKAYREHVAKQRQLSLLAELAEEEAKAAVEANRRQREKDKKKSKKLVLKQQREEEAQRKALEAKRKAEKVEAAREKEAARRLQQLEQDRVKQEAHRRKIEERMAQLAIESKPEFKAAQTDGTDISSQHAVPLADTSASEFSTTAQNSSGATLAASLASKKLKGKSEKAKLEKSSVSESTKWSEKLKSLEKSKTLEKPQIAEKSKQAEKPKVDKMKSKPGEKIEPGKVKALSSLERLNVEDNSKKPEAELQSSGGASLSAGQTLSNNIKADVSNSKALLSHTLTDRETTNDPSRHQGSDSWPQSQGVATHPGSTLQQSPSAKDPLFTSAAPSSTHGVSLPSGIGTMNSIAQSGNLGDISGLSSNLGGGPYGPTRNHKLATGPPPGMGALPLQNPIGMGLGSNLASPKSSSPGVLGSALAGGIGSRINGPVYPGFTMNGVNQGSGDAPPPLLGANTNVIGSNMDGLSIYRRQPQQPQQSPKPHHLPQYSSVSSLWSPSGTGLSPGANSSWQRSPWNDDRIPENANMPQVATPSPWKNLTPNSFAKQASAIDISEAVRRCYKNVQGLGVDGYVPSQVLYHAVQSQSGLRFSQNELHKACSRLPSFDCMRDNVGLITHIKL